MNTKKNNSQIKLDFNQLCDIMLVVEELEKQEKILEGEIKMENVNQATGEVKEVKELTIQELEQKLLEAKKKQEQEQSKYTNIEKDIEGIQRIKKTRERINEVMPERKLVNTDVVSQSSKNKMFIMFLISVIAILGFFFIRSNYQYNIMKESNYQLQSNYKYQQANLNTSQEELNLKREENARLKKYDTRYDDLAQRLSAEQQEVDRLRAENSQLQTTIKKMDKLVNDMDTEYNAKLKGYKNEIRNLEKINEDYDNFYKLEKRITGGTY